jgi:hypothetical protein
MRLGLGALVVLLALMSVSTAGAAQRFAAPEGKGGEPCAQAAPCSLKDAVSSAKVEDEVIVGTGSYTVTSAILIAPVKNLYIHGDFGGAMPRINASLPGPPLLGGESTHVAYLEVFNTAGESAYGFFCGPGWRIERVRVLALSGNNPYGIFESESCLVRDSVVRAQGNNANGLVALSNGPLPINRNLTVSASGTGSFGAVVTTAGPGAADLRNTILAGDAADLKVSNEGKVFVGNSNFDTSKIETKGLVIDLGGNQTAPPLFVDAAKGDFREATGSPTIDAGTDDQLGAVDFAGGARIVGSAVDIGAFEFVPVPPVGQIQSLAVKPGAFRAGNVAGAVASRRKKAAAPVGARVSYSLSAPGSVDLSVERLTGGRRAGKKCVKQTAANKAHKKCSFYKPIKGSFSVTGAGGPNSFKFSGRIGGKPLKPGSYRLTGAAGDAARKAVFKIVK